MTEVSPDAAAPDPCGARPPLPPEYSRPAHLPANVPARPMPTSSTCAKTNRSRSFGPRWPLHPICTSDCTPEPERASTSPAPAPAEAVASATKNARTNSQIDTNEPSPRPAERTQTPARRRSRAQEVRPAAPDIGRVRPRRRARPNPSAPPDRRRTSIETNPGAPPTAAMTKCRMNPSPWPARRAFAGCSGRPRVPPDGHSHKPIGKGSRVPASENPATSCEQSTLPFATIH